MAPSDEAELTRAVATAAAIDDAPSAFRYPRGEGIGCPIPENAEVFEIGKGRIVRDGERLAVLSLGTRLMSALEAADMLAEAGAHITVADARFAKPIDTDLITRLMRDHDSLILVEEGSAGGFAAHVMQFMANAGLLDQGKSVRVLALPDTLIDHNSQDGQLNEAGLDAEGILLSASALLGIDGAKLAALSPR